MMIRLLFALLATAGTEHYERANRYFQQQQFSQAAEELTAALKENPNLVPALTLRAKLAMGLNRFDDAREDLLRAVALQPDSAYVQFMLGFYYYVDNDFQKAIPPLEIARKLNAADARTVFYLALSNDGLGRAETAIPLYETAIALEQKSGHPTPDIHVSFARLLFSLYRFSDNQTHVARALALDPKSPDGRY